MRTFLRAVACIAVLVTASRAWAAGVVTMNPNLVDVGNVAIGGPDGTATGSLSDTMNEHVDLDNPTGCSGGGGTFTTLDSGGNQTNINLNSPATITVTYHPTASGTRTCNVKVFLTGTTTLLGTFQIRGTGQTPPAAMFSGNPDFGSVRANDAAPIHTSNQVFQIQNTGDQDLVVTAVALGGTNMGDFAITAAPSLPKTITKNNTAQWTVQFNAGAIGNRSGTLTFTSNDASSPKVYSLVGVGTTAIIGVTDIDFLIVNNGSSVPMSALLSNSAASFQGPLGVTQASITGASCPGASCWFAFNGCGNGTTCNFAPPPSITSGTYPVSVKCSPPVGTPINTVQNATVSYTSDTDPSADTTSSLTCKAGQSQLGTDVPSVAFAGVHIGMPAAFQTVTVTNNGTVADSYYYVVSQVAGDYSVTTEGSACGTIGMPCPLAPSAQVKFDINFTPSAEGDIPGSITIHTVTAPAPFPTLSLTGRGTEQHISVQPTMSFPDTFRNPGSLAVPTPVTITNSGEYMLHVSGLQVSSPPEWVLDDPNTVFDVPGLGSHDVMVNFLPTAAGKANMGALQIMNDDPVPAKQLSVVVLFGNGKDRPVKMFPNVDIGDTGAGVPTRLSAVKPRDQWLQITNMDDTNTFTIRQFKMEGDDVFVVQDENGNSADGTPLPPMTTKVFDVVFNPPTVGDYVANIALYLDEDPSSQQTVPAHGRALFVDAHGGGGCSIGAPTDGGGGTGGGAIVIVAFALRRRRRAVGEARGQA